MRLLILGGSGFVGRAVAGEAVRRGDDVTVFNRGRRDRPAGVTALTGDRLAEQGLAAVAHGEWDAVVDTWSADGEAVRRAAGLLRGRAGVYLYVSSRSVYASGTARGEGAPLADPQEPGYAGDKLRGELGTAAFGGPVLLARGPTGRGSVSTRWWRRRC